MNKKTICVCLVVLAICLVVGWMLYDKSGREGLTSSTESISNSMVDTYSPPPVININSDEAKKLENVNNYNYVVTQGPSTGQLLSVIDNKDGTFTFVTYFKPKFKYQKNVFFNWVGKANLYKTDPVLANQVLEKVSNGKQGVDVIINYIFYENGKPGAGQVISAYVDNKFYVMYGPDSNSTKDLYVSTYETFELKPPSSTSTPTPSTSSSSMDELVKSITNKSKTYDNYNHYSGTSTPTVFHGPNGSTAMVTAENNVATIIVRGENGSTMSYQVNPNETTSSKKKKKHHHQKHHYAEEIYYGPKGGYAILLTDEKTNVQIIIVVFPDGSKMVYKTESEHTKDTDIAQSLHMSYEQLAANSDAYLNGNYFSKNITRGSSSSKCSFNKRCSYSCGGLHGSKKYCCDAAGTPCEESCCSGGGGGGDTYYPSHHPNNNYNYNDYLPKGIPRRMIPPGDEDMYILKTEVVPPICPACPRCPDCPGCSSCSVPSVPAPTTSSPSASNTASAVLTNTPHPTPTPTPGSILSADSSNQNKIPIPVLNSFSAF